MDLLVLLLGHVICNDVSNLWVQDLEGMDLMRIIVHVDGRQSAEVQCNHSSKMCRLS